MGPEPSTLRLRRGQPKTAQRSQIFQFWFICLICTQSACLFEPDALGTTRCLSFPFCTLPISFSVCTVIYSTQFHLAHSSFKSLHLEGNASSFSARFPSAESGNNLCLCRFSICTRRRCVCFALTKFNSSCLPCVVGMAIIVSPI